MSVKSNILSYIESLPSRSDKKVIVGQQTGNFENNPWTNYDHFYLDLYDTVGEFPSLIGIDLRRYNPYFSQPSIDDRLWLACNYWDSGGLVHVSHFTLSPFGGVRRFGNNRTDDWDLLDCITPGEPEYDEYMDILDEFITDLQVLTDRGLVVFLRPFHEMNLINNWWWAPRTTEWASDPDHCAEQYVTLWQHLYNFVNVTHGLADQIIWVYGTANRQTDVGKPTLDHFYPGDAYADIVGTSIYMEDFTIRGTGYSELQSLNKPLMSTESGREIGQVGPWSNTTFINSIRNNYPDMVGFWVWETWGPTYEMAIIDNDDPDFGGDDWIIWRGELPINRRMIGCSHDKGDDTDWDTDNDADNDVAITVAAALNGTVEGMAVTVDDANQASYARFITPKHNRVKYGFWIDPNGISIPANDFIFVCRFGIDGAPWTIADVVLYYDGADYGIRLDLMNDGVVRESSPVYTITDAPHFVETMIARATSAISDDGYAKLWIDGVERLGGDSPLVDNYDIWDLIDELHLGAVWVENAATSGVFYLDELFGEVLPPPVGRDLVAAGVGRGVARGVR